MEYREVELIGGGHENDDGYVATKTGRREPPPPLTQRRQPRLPQDAARGEREERACVRMRIILLYRHRISY
jgi:hypothetical protein